jgi:hypothetical protein
MEIDQDKLKQAETILGVLDLPTKGDLQRVIEAIIEAVTGAVAQLNGKIDARLAEIRNGRDGAQGKQGEQGPPGAKPVLGVDYTIPDLIPGPPGPPGQDAKPVDVDAAIKRVEYNLPQFGTAYVDAINLLPTDNDVDKIDASHIKNLPESKVIYEGVGGGHGPLWALQDVDVAGITAGQHLEWDGIKWIPVTPAGGGGTPVWGEDLTTQGAGTSFILANTPIAGTVRIYRGGAYQQAGIGNDYTISGATITLSSSLQAPDEKLLADYSH